MIEFSDDEDAYRTWVGSNPTGFVINQRWDGKHLVLHKARCTWVNRPEKHTNSDAQSTKICDASKTSLVQGIQNRYGRLPENCKVCKP